MPPRRGSPPGIPEGGERGEGGGRSSAKGSDAGLPAHANGTGVFTCSWLPQPLRRHQPPLPAPRTRTWQRAPHRRDAERQTSTENGTSLRTIVAANRGSTRTRNQRQPLRQKQRRLAGEGVYHGRARAGSDCFEARGPGARGGGGQLQQRQKRQRRRQQRHRGNGSGGGCRCCRRRGCFFAGPRATFATAF
jgi:hypothetical protein